MTSRWIAAVVGAVWLVATQVSPASATFHLMKIREIFPGTAAAPGAQYVMLQMYFAGQNLVSGHFIRVFDAGGATVATFTFAANVANGADQATILIATTDAQTLFGITADLLMTPVLPAAGGAVCFDAIPNDCVSWGSFSGTLPDPAGTPFNAAGGLLMGHAIRRDISAGNPALLEASDDTNDSANDFDCVNTASPKNNGNATGSYTDPMPCPAPPTPTDTPLPTQTPTSTPTNTPTITPIPTHDAVVLLRKPLNISVPAAAATPITKKLRVPVRNADVPPAAAQIIQLDVTSDCPVGVTFGTPDFDAKAPGIQQSIAVNAGKTKTAVVPILIDHTLFTPNKKVPIRCTVTATASFPLVTGNVDPNPSNDQTTIELNILDKQDTPTSTTQETVIRSLPPLTFKIPADSTTGTGKTKPTVVNGDIIPMAATPGHSITLSLNPAGCPALTFGAIDIDAVTGGAQPSVVVKGGASAKATVSVSAPDTLVTPNAKSPLRCTVEFTAAGPTDPDGVPSNNMTRLVIDVLDKNDF